MWNPDIQGGVESRHATPQVCFCHSVCI